MWVINTSLLTTVSFHCDPGIPTPFHKFIHSLPWKHYILGHHCPCLALRLKSITKLMLCLFNHNQFRNPILLIFWLKRDIQVKEEGSHHVYAQSSLSEANGCLSSFPWFPVIKPPLRHFKRPAYASSSYAPSAPKKTDDHPVRYKMLDQRIKMKKIQNISHHWNKK